LQGVNNVPKQGVRCGKPQWNCDLQISHLAPFTLPSSFNPINMMQTIRLHHTNYTKQMPNVKSGQTEMSSARLDAVEPGGWAFERKCAEHQKDSAKVMTAQDIMARVSLPRRMKH
jgi:hypothetical protein